MDKQIKQQLILMHREEEINSSHLDYLNQIMRTSNITIFKAIEPIIRQKIVPQYLTTDQWDIQGQYYQYQLYKLLNSMQQSLNMLPKNSIQIVAPYWIDLKYQFQKLSKRSLSTEKRSFIQKSCHKSNEKNNNQIFVDYVSKYEKDDLQNKKSSQISKLLQHQQWCQLLDDIQRHIDLQKQNQNKEKSSIHETMNKFQIYDIQPKPTDICCARFFYQNSIIKSSESKQTFHEQIEVINNSDNFKENQIRQLVVSLLNSFGGFILFDCQKIGKRIIAKGRKLTQFQKQKIEQRITSFLESVSPLITVKKHYGFSWVPIIANYSRKFENTQNPQNPSCIQGTYVLRLQVFPIEAKYTFHFTTEQNSFFMTRLNSQPVQLQGNQIHEFIKKRFKANNKKIMKHSHFDKKMIFPYSGNKLYPQQKIQILPSPIQENQFKFISLIIVEKQKKNQIIELLKINKIAHEFVESQVKFGVKFRLAQTTHLLYHNERFDKVQSIIKNSNIRFGDYNKQVILISTTNYLQCLKITHENVKGVEEFMRKTLKLNVEFQSKESKKQHYTYHFKIGSILAAIGVYFTLDHYKFKVRFIKASIATQYFPQPQFNNKQIVYENKKISQTQFKSRQCRP